jgi:hypothetical protein
VEKKITTDSGGYEYVTNANTVTVTGDTADAVSINITGVNVDTTGKVETVTTPSNGGGINLFSLDEESDAEANDGIMPCEDPSSGEEGGEEEPLVSVAEVCPTFLQVGDGTTDTTANITITNSKILAGDTTYKATTDSRDEYLNAKITHNAGIDFDKADVTLTVTGTTLSTDLRMDTDSTLTLGSDLTFAQCLVNPKDTSTPSTYGVIIGDETLDTLEDVMEASYKNVVTDDSSASDTSDADSSDTDTSDTGSSEAKTATIDLNGHTLTAVVDVMENTEITSSVKEQGTWNMGYFSQSNTVNLLADLTVNNTDIQYNSVGKVYIHANGNTFTTTDSVTTSKSTGTGSVAGDHPIYVFGEGGTLNLQGGNYYQVYAGSGTQAPGDLVHKKSFNYANSNASVTIGEKAYAAWVHGGSYESSATYDTVTLTVAGEVDYILGGGSSNGNSNGEATDTTANKLTINLLQGGVVNQNIYGGGHFYGTVTSDIDINIAGTVTKEVYGGGRHNTVDSNETVGNVHITVADTGLVKLNVYGGGEKASVVGNTDIDIYGTVNKKVYGGSSGSSLTGNTSVTVYKDGTVKDDLFGGGSGNVTGDTSVVIYGKAAKVYGGSNNANVGGSATVQILDGGTTSSVYGGGTNGNVGGDVSVTVSKDSTVGGMLYGAGNKCAVGGGVVIDVDGTVTSSIYGSGTGCTVEKDVAVDVAGTVTGYVYGGGDSATIKGSTSVDVSGTVTGYVYGGGYSGTINGNTSVTVSGLVKQYAYGGGGTVGGDASVTILAGGEVTGTVYGGGSKAVSGSTSVQVLGTAGTVYGGGSGGDVGNGTSVTISDNAIVTGNVYGGGYSGTMNGDASITISDNAEVKGSVYGGGYYGTIAEDVFITISDDAKVDTSVYGSGYYKTNVVKGDAFITLKDKASVGGLISGNRTNGTLKGDAFVTFDNDESSCYMVKYAKSVKITNGSNVTLDNEGADNEQLVYVNDLTIDNGATLTLLASAAIDGDYIGTILSDTEDETTTDPNLGTLVLPVGKKLTAKGNVYGVTNISIVDADDGTVPAENQVYVVSANSETDSDANFIWVDRRKGLTMAWQLDPDDATISNWYLTAYDEPEEPTTPTEPDPDPDPTPDPDPEPPTPPRIPDDVIDKIIKEVEKDYEETQIPEKIIHDEQLNRNPDADLELDPTDEPLPDISADEPLPADEIAPISSVPKTGIPSLPITLPADTFSLLSTALAALYFKRRR